MAHSAEAKANALAQLEQGHTLAEVHNTTGIPKRTLADWASKADIDVVSAQARAKTARAREALGTVTAEKRANLAAGLMADAQRLRAELFAPCVERKAMTVNAGGDLGQDIEVAEVHHDQPPFADQVKIMTAVAIAVDKIQLLTGEATDRHEFSGAVRDQVLADAREKARHLHSVPA